MISKNSSSSQKLKWKRTRRGSSWWWFFLFSLPFFLLLAFLLALPLTWSQTQCQSTIFLFSSLTSLYILIIINWFDCFLEYLSIRIISSNKPSFHLHMFGSPSRRKSDHGYRENGCFPLDWHIRLHFSVFYPQWRRGVVPEGRQVLLLRKVSEFYWEPQRLCWKSIKPFLMSRDGLCGIRMKIPGLFFTLHFSFSLTCPAFSGFLFTLTWRKSDKSYFLILGS